MQHARRVTGGHGGRGESDRTGGRQITDLDLTGSGYVPDDAEAFQHVKYLRLGRTNLTLEAAKKLGTLTHLQALTVTGATLTDEALAELVPLTNLAWLDLSQTAVTDAGILRFRESGHLQYLLLKKTRVTFEGTKTLKDSLPQTRILVE